MCVSESVNCEFRCVIPRPAHRVSDASARAGAHLDDPVARDGYAHCVYAVGQLAREVRPGEALADRGPEHVVAADEHGEVALLPRPLDLLVHEVVLVVVRPEVVEVVVLRPVRVEVHLDGAVAEVLVERASATSAWAALT